MKRLLNLPDGALVTLTVRELWALVEGRDDTSESPAVDSDHEATLRMWEERATANLSYREAQ